MLEMIKIEMLSYFNVINQNLKLTERRSFIIPWFSQIIPSWVDFFDQPLKIDEITKALKSTVHSKSLENDGLTVEF